MNVETFRDVVEWTRALHEHLARCLKHCSTRQEEERAKWLLEYLADHEAALEKTVTSFKKQAATKALNTWLYDYIAYAPIKPHLSCSAPYAEMSFDEICQEVFDLHEQVIGFYRYLEGRTEIPETRKLIGELLKLEEHEAMRLVHQTNRSKDLYMAQQPSTTATDRLWPATVANQMMLNLLSYQTDLWQRSVLHLDTLRERANNMLEHERAGKPPLLDFDYETVLDGRRLERPANYALLRITRGGDDCLEDCLDATKPPVVIVDPRAGHGPGIGGFKRDSEVGMALHEGHPVYFVAFFPEPVAGQTLGDVLDVLRRFVETVAERHPGKPPVLYGNCQAGWAIALLAADCEGLVGPAPQARPGSDGRHRRIALRAWRAGA